MFTKEELARNAFIDNLQALRNLTLDLPHGYYYPKPSSRGTRELNRDARLAVRQYETIINQGINSGLMRPVHGLSNVIMIFLNEAGVLMSRLYEMRNRREVSRRTWRRARKLHRMMWNAVGNPPHNEF